jgi:hypothetical protein
MDRESAPQALNIQLSPDELRYLVACGAALLQNIPQGSLVTYTSFSKDQIVQFSNRIRKVMDANGIDM